MGRKTGAVHWLMGPSTVELCTKFRHIQCVPTIILGKVCTGTDNSPSFET